MSGLTELYQNVILEHNRSPRNYGELAEANRRAEGNNPLCGDQLTVWLRIEGDVVAEATFKGMGCAISRASASLMTSAIKGRRRGEVERLFAEFQELVTGKRPSDQTETLGKLAVFSGVSQFPVRVKCASLAWHAMKAALTDAAPAQRQSTQE
jgi:nitrogen fixation NifU-like protein